MRLSVKSLGPLLDVDVEFGDMTILVGPQASGKSIFLQLTKLVVDSGDITGTLKKHGFDWQGKLENFFPLYFGEGMQGLVGDGTRVSVDGKEIGFEQLLSRRGKKEESLFLIPAQRVITLRDGWPRPFSDYAVGDPYVVKQFSEQLRQLMEKGLGGTGKDLIFPQERRMAGEIRDVIGASIFGGSEVKLDRSGVRKRIVLETSSGSQLPFMVWSAGQREFIPLLMGLYWLMPPAKIAKREGIDWVVIEEPEMGLHPQAISALLVVFLELMHRGYKVIVSTHSPQVLEMVWAVQLLAEKRADPDTLRQMFLRKRSGFSQRLGQSILGQGDSTRKTFKTYYFSRQGDAVTSKDISALDPVSDDDEIADWGELTAFSTRVSDIVSDVMGRAP